MYNNALNDMVRKLTWLNGVYANNFMKARSLTDFMIWISAL